MAIIQMLGYRLGLVTRKTLKQRMHRLMLGRRISRAEIQHLADSFAIHLSDDGFDLEVVDLMQGEISAGHTIAIATAAHRYYAQAIACRLGVDNLIATESVWQGDDLTCDIAGENCYGPAKAARILEYVKRMGLEPGSTFLRFYSDDASDLPSFELSDEKIAVKPSPRLAKVAATAGWLVLHPKKPDHGGGPG